MENQGRNSRQVGALNRRNIIDRRDYNERRNDRDDETQPTYFEQLILQHLQTQQTPAQSTSQVVPADITKTSLTLQQIGTIAIVVGSIIISGFSAWTALNKDLDAQKSSFVSFKESISKDVIGLEKTISEIKKANDDLKLENKKSFDVLESRIQDLDTTVTQIYQKVSQKP